MLRKVSHILTRSTPIAMSLILLVLAIIAMVAEPTAMITLRHAAFDSYQRRQPREYRPAGVRVIDVDDDSLARFGQWPWSRDVVAELISRLQNEGVSAIGLDILFAETDRTSPKQALARWLEDPSVNELVERLPDYDRVLAEQISAGSVVTAFSLDSDPQTTRLPAKTGHVVWVGDVASGFLPGFEGAVVTLEEFEEAATGNGAMNAIVEEDAVIRRLQLLWRCGDAICPSLAAEVLRVAQGAENYIVTTSGAETGIVSVRIGSSLIATDAHGAMWLHYSEPAAQRTIPAWKVLSGEIGAEELRDAMVFVGTSAAGLKDLRVSSLGEDIAGVEAHAQAIEQILQGTYLTRPDWAVAAEVLLMAVMWIVLVTLILRLGALPAALVGLAAMAAAFLGSWLAFTQYRLLLDPTFPSLTALAVYLVCSASRHFQTERDKRWIRQAFSSYISPNLVRHLIENPNELALGGERRECSFVLSDLESFTSLVERSEPSLVVGLLNEYLAGMVRIALAHEGTLDRIVGDSVAVMFSAPAVQLDHAARAVACAVEIDQFARSFRDAKLAEGITVGRTRVGVNTGMVTVGNVGGEALIDYRALGDAVNTTARLETVNGQLGTNVCISGVTVAACPDFVGRPVGSLVLKGKSEGIQAFEPLSREQAEAPAAKAYLEAFALLERGDESAETVFARLHEEAPDDPLVAFHLRRLQSGDTGATVVLHRK